MAGFDSTEQLRTLLREEGLCAVMTAAEKLTEALEAAGAPRVMIANARRGHYGDYTSELATPITTLVREALSAGLEDIARRAMNGEFDGE